MTRLLGAAPLLLLWAMPLVLALIAFAMAAVGGASWQPLFAHPQLWPGLWLSLWTGTLGAGLALLLALVIAAGLYRTRAWHRLQAISGVGLALPHLAFAIGLGFLIMPSGLVARLVVGGDIPPQWITVQDPLGLSLIAALTLKEIPFLLAMMWSALARGDLAQSLEGQWRAARSLGHGPGSIWLRVVQPQMLRRLLWPIVIVWVYGATVVDVALVIGPTQPPPLAVVVWHDLNDAVLATNQRGIAGAVFLCAALAISGGGVALVIRGFRHVLRPWFSGGPSHLPAPKLLSGIVLGATAAVYALVMGVHLLMAVSARWPYPGLWPDGYHLAAVLTLLSDPSPVLLSLGLGVGTTLAALAAAVLWFETQAETRDRWLVALALAALGLPQLVIAAGQYRMFLSAGLTATLCGLFLVHLTPVVAYVAIVLAGPYRAFDQRYASAARALNAGPWRTWWRVKAPLLGGPLFTAAAVGFAVCMVQFVPAQLIAAGRFSTLPMEAVTLSSGGNRALTAVYALALALPPLIGFAAAGLAGRPRWG